jgi:hypothetical protein
MSFSQMRPKLANRTDDHDRQPTPDTTPDTIWPVSGAALCIAGGSPEIEARLSMRLSMTSSGNTNETARRFGGLNKALTRLFGSAIHRRRFHHSAGLLWSTRDTAMASRCGRPLGAVAVAVLQCTRPNGRSLLPFPSSITHEE